MAKSPKDATAGQPRGDVPAVPCRYLFWTEWGQYPRIERSRLDGTERMVLVNVSISWPNGISVDYEVRPPAGRTGPAGASWGAAAIPRALESPPQGQEGCAGWRELGTVPPCCSIADGDAFPSPQDGKLYWCDARTDKIERIDLETGENREVVLSSNNMDMFSVSVFEEYIYWSDRYGARGFGRCCGGDRAGCCWRSLRWPLGDSLLS